MKITLLLSFCLLASVALLPGCEEKVKGCMDIDAYNVDVTAEEDCCCKFRGSLVFWHNQASADAMADSGITDLTFYVDGQMAGTENVSKVYSSPPLCGDAGVLTVVRDLGDTENKPFTYEVKDQDGNLMWSGIKTFAGGKCQSINLIY
jgi:hypothetical protein